MAEPNETEKKPDSRIIQKLIEEEMKVSYLTYSMSVIVGRALPDVRDGLKPVHRRVLYTMYESGLTHSKPFKKSATVVGNCMAKYHPHGDLSIYDTLVRLAQNFSLRYPLVIGQGNFGSVDGDSPAAMRYTEAKMHQLAEEIIADIEKDTVKWTPNYDGSTEEPSVLPSKAPNLLLNGSSGIAVGMATNIPPHNLREIGSAIIATIDNPEITILELLKLVSGPDFPTGALIVGRNGIRDAYTTGKGKIICRSRTHIEEEKNGRQTIIVDEIPYQINKALLVEHIAELVRDKIVVGITDLRDESDRDGMRIVLELKSGANSDVVLNQLLKHSRLQTTFGVTMLALVSNQPKILTLKQMLVYFIEHRHEMIANRTKYDLRKAQERLHILNGLVIALNDIDSIIAMIKAAKNAEQARKNLTTHFPLDDIQAAAILDLKLQRLTSLEQQSIREEQGEIKIKILRYEQILGSREEIMKIIKEETTLLTEKYGDERKTSIIEGEADLETEDLIKSENAIITITHAGYVKRIAADTYKEQRRGGKGIIAADTKEEDFLEHLFVANTHSWILFFTDKGKVNWLKVYQVPEAGRYARGTAIVNLIQLAPDEKITAFVVTEDFKPGKYVIMATEQGTVKKVPLEEFNNPRKGGIAAIGLQEKDRLVNAVLTDGKQDILLATQQGLAIRFSEEDVRSTGRTAQGVRGIKLRESDKLIGMILVEDGKTVFTVTAEGLGKRTEFSEYSTIGRGGVGVINMKVTDKGGKIVAVRSVREDDSIILISKSGIVLRSPIKDINIIGRNTQGVRVMKLEEKDEVAGCAPLIAEEPHEGTGTLQ